MLGEGAIARVYGVNNESAVPADAVPGVIMNTVFGPFVVGGSYGTTGHHEVFFEVGKLFCYSEISPFARASDAGSELLARFASSSPSGLGFGRKDKTLLALQAVKTCRSTSRGGEANRQVFARIKNGVEASTYLSP